MSRSSLVIVLVSAVSLLACGTSPGEKSATEETITPTPRLRLDRTIASGQEHRFYFDVEADRYLHLGVEQQGVDVVVVLSDPLGRDVFEIDSPNGSQGWEEVIAVSRTGGEHCLEVRPLDDDAQGRFALEIFDLRAPTDEDRLRGESAAAMARGKRCHAEGDFQQSAEAFRHALPGLEALGDRKGAALARWRLGEALVELGELLQALPALERAAAEFEDLEDGVGQARVLIDLGKLWRELGELDKAGSVHRRCLELYREAGVEIGQGSALHNLGVVAEMTGDLAGALDLYEQALDIWRRFDRRSAQAMTLKNLGSLYALVGREEEAFDFLRQAVDLLSDSGKERKLMSALMAIGWAHHLAGNPETALEHYDRALDLARQLDDPIEEAVVLDRQGTAFVALERFDAAAATYERARAAFRSSGRRLDEARTLVNQGWLELRHGQAETATQRLTQALSTLTEAGDTNSESYTRLGLARLARMRGDLAVARRHLDRAVELVEELRGEVRSGLSRSSFLSTRYGVLEERVTLLMELHRREPDAGYERLALDCVERARARGLLEALIESEGPMPSAQDARRRRMLAEIRALEARRMAIVSKDPADPQVGHVEKLIRGRWLEVESLEATLATHKAKVRTPSIVEPLTTEQIQELTDSETLLLVYFLAEPESFAWTIDADRVEVHRLPGRHRVEDRARQAASNLPRSHETAFSEQARRSLAALSEAILDPVAARLAGLVRLAVLADGALHYVPFAALPVPGESEPLLKRHELTTLPSATVLAFQRQADARRTPPTRAVAVVADPVYDATDPRLMGTSAAEEALPDDLVRTVRALDLGRLGRLPYTAHEAEAILAMTPREESLGALGFRADRKLVESGGLREYRIVHFAVHGLVHPVHPGLSGIVLSLLDENGHARDGFLRAHEVASLGLSAELVVASACSSGLGREIRGEGLIGLTQAFFQAGARRVLVSSWNVNDEATAELMARFYRHLLEDNLSPAAALRQAQLAILAEERWSAPYFWASFSLQGDWR